MDESTYRVTAPYVTMRVRGRTGVQVVGFHQGAVLPPGVEPDSLGHHLKRKLVEKVDMPRVRQRSGGIEDGSGKSGGSPDPDPGPAPASEVETPAPAPTPEPEPVQETAPAGPPPETGPGSGKGVWVDYAITQGMTRAEAEGMSRNDLVNRFRQG